MVCRLARISPGNACLPHCQADEFGRRVLRRKKRKCLMTPTPPRHNEEAVQRLPVYLLSGQRVIASRTDDWTPRGCLKKSRATDCPLHVTALQSSPLTRRCTACRPVPVVARCWIGKRHARNALASRGGCAVARCCPCLCAARHRHPEATRQSPVNRSLYEQI